MKAIALISGGLDSELATRLVLQQGIEVVAVHFNTPFCLCNKKGSCKYEALRVVEILDLPLKTIFLGEEYLEIVKKPKYGYGKNLNPCIDCRILMFRKAKQIMNEVGASFVITGEVLGQRPKSQNIKALKIIEKESGLEGYILRPLSAKVLPETIPEKNGWVDRNKLLAITGRSRKQQFKLAEIFDMKNYPCPAGGCLLTDPNFAKRMKDLLVNCDSITLRDVNLLKIGKHFRISKEYKLIIGRNEQENNKIISLKQKNDVLFEPSNVKGPVGLGVGNFSNENLIVSSKILASYCKDTYIVKIKISTDSKLQTIEVEKADIEQFINYRI